LQRRLGSSTPQPSLRTHTRHPGLLDYKVVPAPSGSEGLPSDPFQRTRHGHQVR